MTTSLSRTGELTAIAFAIACTGATFSIFALPVAAKDYPIVVAPLTEMETWTKDINRSLNRRLEQTTTGDARGIVQLRFMLDEEGHPENILIYRSSGERRTDRAAMEAVDGLKRLNRAPVRNVDERTFQANIIFAMNQRELAQFAKELKLSEIARLAQANTDTDIISFGA